MKNIQYLINQAKERDVFIYLQHVDKYFNPPLSQVVNLDKFSKKIFDNSTRVEAWDQKVLIGLLSVYFNRLETKVGFINHISILNNYKNRGISKVLMQECIKYGLNNNFQSINLEVEGNNKIAINLYSKFGFKLDRHKNNSIFMKKILNKEIE